VRVALIHGAATTSRVWRRVVPWLPSDWQVVLPERPATGNLDLEIEHLAPLCSGAMVVGVSGGATLGLELVSRGVPIAAALLHEPAVGSFAPGLLNHVADGLAAGGVAGFGRALYGPFWTSEETEADQAVVEREFAMFGGFHPSPPGPAAARVVISTGADSPPARQQSVTRLCEEFGFPQAVVDGCRHAAHLEAPRRFAEMIVEVAERWVTPVVD